MRHLVALVGVALCLQAGVVRAQDSYAAVLLEYLSGDADKALTRLADLSQADIQAGINAFDTTRSSLVLTGAAAMHTEEALRHGGSLIGNYHLLVATAIVQFGEHPPAKTNTPLQIHPRFASPVSAEFRHLWYCAVINRLQSAAMVTAAQQYLDHATGLYPDNPEIHLLAGIEEEMRGNPRTADRSAGDRRKALSDAEKEYRAVVKIEPTRLEAKLRLARVLQQLGHLDEARTLLTPLLVAPDARVVYLASLFLGGIEDAAGHPDAAATLYTRAAAILPTGQTARLAASELLYRHGEREAAAEAIPEAAGADNTFDPWWTYAFGEYWRGDLLVAALRLKRRG